MPGPLIPLAIAAAAGLASSGIEMWHNSPKRQVKRLQKGGIHKNAFYEMGDTGNIGTPDLGIDAGNASQAFSDSQDRLFAEELHPSNVTKSVNEAKKSAIDLDQTRLDYSISSYIDQIKRRNPGPSIEYTDGLPSGTVQGVDAYEAEVIADKKSDLATAEKAPISVQQASAELDKVIADTERIQELANKYNLEVAELEAGFEWFDRNAEIKNLLLENALKVSNDEVNQSDVEKEIYEIIAGIDNQYAKAAASALVAIASKLGGSSKGGNLQIDIK